MNTFYKVFLSLCLLLQVAEALAHGSVVPEGDLCIIRIGFYTAHFKVYQPQASRDREFCEDLPGTGETVFVMDYIHKGLALVPIEFRIIRDATGLGRYAALDDVLKLGDLEPLTVFHQSPVIETGVFTVLHNFTETGAFLGLVSARHPDTGEIYSAVFPFSVGFRGWGMLPLFAALTVLAQLGYWLFTGGFARWQAKRSAAVAGANKYTQILMLLPLFLLMGAAQAPDLQSWTSQSGALKISFTSTVNPVPLNEIHSWTLHLTTSNGTPVANAKLSMSGGMPMHNHGLPTDPVVTSYLGNGDYRVEGVRFHMQGAWEMLVTVTQNNASETIIIPLTL